MAYFLFIDESGQDRRESPYEVLAGVAVRDQDLWNLIQALRDAELRHFGVRYTADRGELKAKRLLKAKTFRLAAQLPPIDPDERRVLAASCLANGAGVRRTELTALAQAKLAYVEEALEICARFRCRAFASLPPLTPRVPRERTFCGKTTRTCSSGTSIFWRIRTGARTAWWCSTSWNAFRATCWWSR